MVNVGLSLFGRDEGLGYEPVDRYHFPDGGIGGGKTYLDVPSAPGEYVAAWSGVARSAIVRIVNKPSLGYNVLGVANYGEIWGVGLEWWNDCSHGPTYMRI